MTMIQVGYFFKAKTASTWNYTPTPPASVQGRPDYEVRAAYIELPQKKVPTGADVAQDAMAPGA